MGTYSCTGRRTSWGRSTTSQFGCTRLTNWLGCGSSGFPRSCNKSCGLGRRLRCGLGGNQQCWFRSRTGHTSRLGSRLTGTYRFTGRRTCWGRWTTSHFGCTRLTNCLGCGSSGCPRSCNKSCGLGRRLRCDLGRNQQCGLRSRTGPTS